MLWGMSNPDEQPGEATEFDWDYYDRMRGRMAALLPATADLGLRKVWAATIDFTPDHLPILGPADHRRRAGGRHRRRCRRRPRDDVGPGRLAGRRRPRRGRARPTSSTSPTSGWTGSTSTAAAGSPPTRSPCRSPRRRESVT